MLVLYFQGAEGTQIDGVCSDLETLQKFAEQKLGRPQIWTECEWGWQGNEVDDEDDEDGYIIVDAHFVPYLK
jgi:hypothetical protein